MSFYNPFEETRDVNLSTSTATSSTALLSSIRAERQAREEKRKHEHAAISIQRLWRGRREGHEARQKVRRELEDGLIDDWRRQAAALVFLARPSRSSTGQVVEPNIDCRELLVNWCRAGLDRPDGFVGQANGDEDWIGVLGTLSAFMVDCIAVDPLSADTSTLFETLERVLDPASWSALDQELRGMNQIEFLEQLGGRGMIVNLVKGLQKLIAASPPKKKHPSLVPLVPLLTAPLRLAGPACPPVFHEQLLNSLLAVPALPASLPLASLTHLSANLPLFTILLPLGAAQPHLLERGGLATENGKTYFLGNLITFGITGGMLARHGTAGAANWIKVVGTLLGGMSEGWGRWADGQPEPEDEVMPLASTKARDDDDDDSDSDEENVPMPGPSRTTRSHVKREPLAPTIQKKVITLASTAHLTTLVETLLTPSAPSAVLTDFCAFALSLLNAFRGSPKWEGILEVFMMGIKGRALEKRIWREGVRGKWGNSGEPAGWDHFTENPSTPCLLLLTHLYNHYMLITPDDEFFDTANSNPLSLDEVLELGGIWRDLSYHAFLNGVAPKGVKPVKGVGTEDERSLMTRGVTRIVERNARRKFADDDFWVMVHHDLKGFIAAAVFEDGELNQPDTEGDVDPADLPRWARNRQKLSKRQLAYVSPRLGLLNNLPMTVPFVTRLKIFRQFIDMDLHRLYERGALKHRLKAKIRRNHLAEDGFDQLVDMGPALKGDVYIKFYDQFGEREAGIDGGGLFKEFLTSLSKEVFDTNRGLWNTTNENQLYPSPHSYAVESHQLRWYAFIGRVLGKALYQGILVDVSFADFFLAKWLGRQSYLDDLASLDKELYKGLIILKNYPRPEELALNFTISEEDFGATTTTDLIPNGSEIPVTAANRHEYIQLVCRHKLDRQISAQSRAFFSGLSDLIDPKWLRMFDQRELRQVIGGEETMIDLEDLRAHCVVSGFPNDITMRLFWKVVEGFDQEQRRALLRFVTSCSRPPLLGFSQLNPQFGVRCAGTDTARLPSASSCFNMLKLPSYQDEASLKSKLLQAINSGAGFDLS